MDQASPKRKVHNPWSNREELARVSNAHLVLATLVCFLCALCIPLCNNCTLALIVLAVLFAYVAAAGRNPLTVSLVLVTAVLFTLLGSTVGIGFSVGAVLLSVVVGCETATLLMTATRRGYLALLIPIAAFGVAYFVTGHLMTSLSALVFLPAEALLALATLRAKGRTTTICFAELGFLLSTVGVFAALIWQTYGNLGPTAIRASVDAVRESLVQALLTVRDQNLATLEGVQADAATQAWIEQINLLYSKETALQMFAVLPAAITVVCAVIAYEAQALLNASYRTVGLGAVLTPSARFLEMSVTSAILFALSFVMSMFTSSATVVGAVMQNLSIILMPGLFVIGVQSIVATVRQARGGMRIVILLIAVLFFCCSGSAFYVLAFWGSYCTVMVALQKRMVEKIVQGGRGDDAPDDRDGED